MSRRFFPPILAALSLLCAAVAVSAAGCGSDQAIVDGSCAAGYLQCGNRCVDLANDPSNCGACGNACAPGSSCALSTCGGANPDASRDDGSGDDGVEPLDGLEGFGDRRPGDGPAADAPSSDGTAPDGVSDAGRDADASTDAPAGDSATDSSPPADATNDSTPPSDSASDTTPTGDTGADSNPVIEAGLDAADADAAAAGDGDAAAAADADAGADAEAGCNPPMLVCTGQCIDPRNDPSNCGDCNIKCVSGLCQNSLCIGTTTGAVVFIGHDYATVPVSAQAHVLSNSVFIPQTNPLNVLSYERYSDAAAITNIKTILAGTAQQVGRTLNITDTVTDSDIPTRLSIQNFSTLLVLDQPGAPQGALAALGVGWATTLATFSQQGGAVVVLDGATGTGEMPAFVTGTGLLAIAAHAPVMTGAPLSVLSRADAVGIGVLNPYAAGANTASITTEPSGGNVVYVVATSSDASSGTPVVVHKVF
jgi:hypothetical protein